MDLGSHIVESEADNDGGKKMIFCKPVFGPQQIGPLLEAIFILNDNIALAIECGTREMRVDRPKDGLPYMVWTVHFPEQVVAYTQQRNFRLAGPDGTIFLFGNEVTTRRQAIFEAAESRRQEEEERRAAEPAPPPSGTPPSRTSLCRPLASAGDLDCVKQDMHDLDYPSPNRSGWRTGRPGGTLPAPNDGGGQPHHGVPGQAWHGHGTRVQRLVQGE
jgi:hypothetical protein